MKTTFNKTTIRAALYCRVAKQNQTALNEQQKYICDYAEKNGYIIQSVISECFSGSTISRPGIKQFLSLAKKRLFDVLVVKDISRICRQRIETYIFIEKLNGYGIKVELVDNGLNEVIF